MSLILEDVGHTYNGSGEWVLRDIFLTMRPGEAVALLGPSGSGKTTLLSIIGLLLEPTRGQIVLDGRVLTGRRQRARGLQLEAFAWIFQTMNMLSRRTALDNTVVGLLAKGEARGPAEQVAAAALASVGLGHLAGSPVHQLSGGELQRVCIARAVAAHPRFLLADEPTGQLDHATSADVLDALWSARHPDTAMVIATHDLEVSSRCDRAIRLVDGRLEEA
jgi:putative ABC transport system ATP-binding protein